MPIPAGTDSLRWRIDPAFDDYVRNRTGDGTVTVTAGASYDKEGFYSFPRTSDPAGLHFGGAVEFRAYLGVLSLRIAEPGIQISQGVAHLSIVDDAAPTGTRLELATATLAPQQAGSTLLDLRLTERGSELFFGKYSAGAALAPINVQLPPPAAGMALTEGAH